ncbi:MULTISPECIES: hypothetical protein [unclassified Bradyrhizobium]|uniref:hypothetical protein n=1 Tax=unclassified Bradyrhizobium TaxID=2631580 RepID=UPI001BA544F5|nr:MULTISPECIES: hypothetical protein [unclassified Bradyrhizobium]MBR1204076.1 hypothetical protein [Bradyrhizobium sp. AUGA SZCCT0124]MBR1310038.1 hypothetical protein [Bradyrhizobium sp. AUGA SZCCT0051]MBR1340179.1 hypothetical protein [Bradyrhizobium sp. AUGA SZCCT0105]MBR1354786.1 hypothetical protein [Bradyrhizobium sp. AUGA SZCCT0045]
MARNQKPVSATLETFSRSRRFIAGTFALAMLSPTGAIAMDSTPKAMSDRAGHVLPLPPVRYLDSMRWMDWKPGAPLFKVDTLLLPDSSHPGMFRLPWDDERDLPRVS